MELKPDSVKTHEDFVRFTRALLQDLERNGTEWENTELWDYLESLIAWTDDMGDRLPEPSWGLFAQILLAASAYE